MKKANFRGLIAKIRHYRPILAIRPHLQPIFIDFAMRIVTLRYIEGVLELIKKDFKGLKGQFDFKKANLRGL